jgi:hypothetical protein
MNGEVIKSFLVGLGFGVDDASLAKFNKSIASATLKVTALYASINLAATGIVKGIADISEGFEQMGYEYRIIAPAINKALVLRRELLKAYSAAGINITKVVLASVRLNLSLAKTKFALEAIYKSVGSRFFGLLTKQSDIFRQKLYQNMPAIQNALERFVKFIFKAVETTTTLGLRVWSILTRVYDFFVKLDKATDGWSTIILGVIAAWKLLNLEFFATPLGMIIAGLLTILTLFDDFKTWQEGGQSLFDWSKAMPSIEAVEKIFQSIGEIVNGLTDSFKDILDGDWSKLISDLGKVAGAFLAISDAIDRMVRSFNIPIITKILDWRDSVDSSIGNFFSGNAAANVANNPLVGPMPNPIGANAGNLTNQTLHNQTNINVQSSADAGSVGQAIAGHQGRVNQDLSRNFKSPVQ